MVVVTVLLLLALSLAFQMAVKQRDRVAERYPALKKPLAAASMASVWVLMCVVWSALAYGVYSLYLRPKPPPPPPDPLPAKIRPPAIKGTIWTVYDQSVKDKSRFSLDVASRDRDDDRSIVWERYDDIGNGKTILTLIRYGCRTGKRAEIYSVYYRNGNYTGFDEDDPKDEEEVDLESVAGAGFLLACFDKMPRVIDDD